MDRQTYFADGRAFNELIARYYKYESEFDSERVLTKASGRGGRADLFLWAEADHSYAIVIETKWTDWDRLQRKGTLRRNLGAHRRQVWSYLNGTISIERGTKGDRAALESIDRQAALVYPRTPRSADIRDIIEEDLGEWGITTLWFDEPPPASTPGGEAWAALQSGEITTDDLRGSLYWDGYLQQLRRPMPGRRCARQTTDTGAADGISAPLGKVKI